MSQQVDTRAGSFIEDPTENVKALQLASAQRQDDLRQLNNERINAEIRTLAVQVEGLEKRMILRAEHAKEVRQLETERVNAIRQVDVLAQNTAAERALVAIQTLAQQTTAERETLRNLVTTTAATIATQTAQDFSRINEAISALQKSSYEGAGKGAGAKNTVTYAIIAVGLLVSLITIGGTVIAIAFAIKR
jgi:hypothetical protein